MELIFLFLGLVSGLRVPWHGNTSCVGDCKVPALRFKMSEVMKLKTDFWAECSVEHECPRTLSSSGPAKCEGGFARDYGCLGIDLLSFTSLEDLGSGGMGNDIWGWVDPDDNREYALACHFDGTTFVDVSNPEAPIVLGVLPTHTVGSSWRDAKVFKHYVFIISEAVDHGMQVFDLHNLRPGRRPNAKDSTSVPVFEEDAWYGEFGSCHNMVINEESGYGYGVGSKTCRGGLHMIDLNDPLSPQYAGCFSDDAYVHDAECVNYNGPDTRYHDHEVCFCFNEDTLTIVDVSDRNTPTMISRTSYSGYQYTHQGWLSSDSKYIFMDDELDEMYGSNKHTRTLVWNVEDLKAPELRNSYYSTETVIDHNLYYLDGKVYLANYCGGLRVYDFNLQSEKLAEIAYFDVAPDCDTPVFLGAWSSYPYFPSGNVVIETIDRGMFVVRLHDSLRQQH